MPILDITCERKEEMPVYVYKCNNCGTKFDRLCKYDCIDEPTTCPTCGTRDYHDNVIGNCHFSFVGGMPSYGGSGHIDSDDE